MVPVIELKGGIPFGVAMGLPLFTATIIAIAGNILIAVILVFLLKPVLKHLGKFGKSLENRFQKKSAKVAGFWGVMLFVAIPLPLTGVWTGSALSVFCNLPKRYAILSVSLGAVICGLCVTLLTLGVISL